MNRKLLLSIAFMAFCVGIFAQKTIAYAITGVQKGSTRWTEVRMIDVNTGEAIESVYKSDQEIPVLNARTGKPIVKKDLETNLLPATTGYRLNGNGDKSEVIVIRSSGEKSVTITRNKTSAENGMTGNTVIRLTPARLDQPFSTSSAAIAFDKKHDRLYYTPMGINQLRYIDIKGKNPSIKYFEDEPFGALAHRLDVANQITRMVIAGDGNGYALSNNAEHLIRFTTNKRAEITNLGSLIDDPANGNNSIHSRNGYGGDMVADDDNNLYLVTANKNVFKISIKDKVATWLGVINGLPRGYSTNGAAVEKGTSIIVSSSTTTLGFYKFDLKTLAAEKLSASESVFKCSDLANGNLITGKEDKKDEAAEALAKNTEPVKENIALAVKYKLGAYPNPALKGNAVNLTFNDFPQGRYQVQLLDINGKLISAENINVGGKMQVHLLPLPKTLAQGNYLVKIVGDANKGKTLATEQIIVH